MKKVKRKYDVVILGGGLTGLSAAKTLTDAGKKVLLVDNSKVGGMVGSYHIKGFQIEEFYHHIFEDDKFLFSILNQFNMMKDLYWGQPTTGFYFKRQIHRLLGVKDLSGFAPIKGKDKANFVKLMVMIKFLSGVISVKDYTAKQFIIKYGSKSLYDSFFKSLLESKYGENADRVSAQWFVERIRLRSNAGSEGEKLGYLRSGGFGGLVHTLLNSVKVRGCKVYSNVNPVLKFKDGKIVGVYVNDKTYEADNFISTIPPKALVGLLGKNIDQGFKKKLESVEYQGAVCVLLGLSRELQRDYYWINLVGTDSKFGAIIEHTNYIKDRDYYGKGAIVYLASYPDLDSNIWKMSDKKIFEMYFKDLKKLFFIKDEHVKWFKVKKDKSAGLVYSNKVMKNRLGFTTPMENLYIAGMFNSYPERSINKSLELGDKVAKKVLEK